MSRRYVGYFVSIVSLKTPTRAGVLEAVEYLSDQGVDGIVVGFDDVPESEFFSPPLTTVRQDFGEVGRKCIEILLRQIESGDGTGHERAVVPARLVVRDSSGPGVK